MAYTGAATRNFADPDFDGEPALVTEQELEAWDECENAEGKRLKTGVNIGVDGGVSEFSLLPFSLRNASARTSKFLEISAKERDHKRCR